MVYPLDWGKRIRRLGAGMRTYGKIFKRKISAKKTWDGQTDIKKNVKAFMAPKCLIIWSEITEICQKLQILPLLFSVIHHLYIYIQKLVKYFTNPAINNHNWGRWVLKLWEKFVMRSYFPCVHSYCINGVLLKWTPVVGNLNTDKCFE